jgi:hypothetical protein
MGRPFDLGWLIILGNYLLLVTLEEYWKHVLKCPIFICKSKQRNCYKMKKNEFQLQIIHM